MVHRLAIRVIPRSKKQSCGLDRAGRITVHVRAVPERGAANDELVAYLANRIGVATSKVRLISGATSRIKRLEITTVLTEVELYHKLGLEAALQGKIDF